MLKVKILVHIFWKDCIWSTGLRSITNVGGNTKSSPTLCSLVIALARWSFWRASNQFTKKKLLPCNFWFYSPAFFILPKLILTKKEAKKLHLVWDRDGHGTFTTSTLIHSQFLPNVNNLMAGELGQCEIKLFLVHFVFPIRPKLVDRPFIMCSLICKPIQMFKSKLYNKDQKIFIEV